MLIFAFPGTGKTSLAKLYSHVIDLELSDIKYDNRSVSHLTKEERKSLKRPLRQWNYRQVYRQAALSQHHQGKSVLLALNFLPSLLAVLAALGDDAFRVAFPHPSLRQEYRERYLKRGNKPVFIRQVMLIWWPTLLSLLALSYLFPNQFLCLQAGENLTNLYQSGRLGQLETLGQLGHGPKQKKIGKPLDERVQGLV